MGQATSIRWTAASVCLALSVGSADAQADEVSRVTTPSAATSPGTTPSARTDDATPVRPVPPPPPPPVARSYLNCVGCAIAGGIVLGAGAAHALVGAVELSDPAPGEENEGRVLLVLAGLHGAVGIPLLIAGLWPVERTGARAGAAQPPPPPVDVAVGPLGGQLRVSF